MIVLGFVLLALGATIHAWDAAKMREMLFQGEDPLRRDMAVPFLAHVVLLIIGLVVLWCGGSFVTALIGAAVYFFILPLLVMRLLKGLGLIP